MKIQGGHKNIRLKKYDYHSGWFFITNKTDLNNNYFINDLLQLVRNELISLVRTNKRINIDYFNILPNHIHVILIFNNSDISLSEFWRRFKALTTLKAKRGGFKGKTLWQYNYFEHIIRNEIALQRIREYIKNNPLKENIPLTEIYQEIRTTLNK